MINLRQKHPVFADRFGAYFCSDCVDWEDAEDVQVHIVSCAASLVYPQQHEQDIDELITDLTKMLENWNDEIIEQFSDLTNTAFDFNEFMQQTLKDILTELVGKIRRFQLEKLSKSQLAYEAGTNLT